MMSPPTMRDVGLHRRQSRRAWRIAFIVFLLSLSVATYWPQLKLPASSPSSDKMLHFLAYASLTLVFAQTDWLRSRWVIVVVMGAWGLFTEWTQGLPGLNRTSTWHDAMANLLGVGVVGVWLWTMRPAGTHLNTVRLAMHRYVLDMIFARLRTWLVLLMLLFLCAGTVIVVSLTAPPRMGQLLIVAAALVTMLVGGGYLLRQWFGHMSRLAQRRPCFSCGQPVSEDVFDERGWGMCAHCGAAVHVSQWREPARPSTQQWLAAAGWPLALGLMLCGGLVIAMLLAAVVFRVGVQSNVHAELWLRASKVFGQLPHTLIEVIDLSVCLVVLAVVVRVLRVRLARFYDRAVRCRVCGHDLSGTPAPNGHGRCGECGTAFERTTDDAGRSHRASMARTASSSR